MTGLSEAVRKEVLAAISRSWGMKEEDLESADIIEIFGICDLMSQVFGGDDSVVQSWLREQRAGLNGQRPIDLIRTGRTSELLSYVEKISGLR